MPRYHLFEAYGVELEYMVVDRDTLAVRPIVDKLFHDVAGRYVSEVEQGPIAWSNELVNHVVELKTNGPAADLGGLAAAFQTNVGIINDRLARHDAMLLPGGAHPFMDPLTETQLWPHESREIYGLYDRIFDCRGHGWSNLQSTHINLPFAGDAEFERLHAAVRVLLPVMPAIAASTPILDGKRTGFADTRLEAYRLNQKRIPSLTGVVIPEPAFNEADYRERIFGPIMRDIRPFDVDGVLDRHFVNSRGAIARFDRGSIEIRLLDIQECPEADLAIVSFIVAVLRAMVNERWSALEEQKAWSETTLADMLLDNIRSAENSIIENAAYLCLFGIRRPRVSAGELWYHLWRELQPELTPEVNDALARIMEQGTLSTRLLRRLADCCEASCIVSVYHELAGCLAQGRMFVL